MDNVISRVNKLYKYKSDADYNIDALCNNQLWVSPLSKMNDPLELGFYIGNTSLFDYLRAIELQNRILDEYGCISFSTSKTCQRLWNYYTNGMHGMVLEFKASTVNMALSEAGLAVLGGTNASSKVLWDSKIAVHGRTVYRDEKAEFSSLYDSFVVNPSVDLRFAANQLFYKDKSWEDEKEYRYVFKWNHLSGDPTGMLMERMMPSAVYIGYRMSGTKANRVEEYCKKVGIPLFMYSIDFKSKSTKYLVRTTVFEPMKSLPVSSDADECFE